LKGAIGKAYAQHMNLAREPSFRLGAIEVRPATREIVHPGGRESVEPRVMSVLVLLARAGGEVVTRDDLIAACWEGRVVSDDAINRVISRVRKVSELTGGQDFALETITKVGYRLVAGGAVAPSAEPAATPQPVAPALARPIVGAARRFWIIGVAAVAAGMLGAWAFWGMNRPQEWVKNPSAPLTLAVLPFDNLGGADGDETLAVGLAREIRNTLSRVRGLRVVSDSSSFAVASEALTATEMGHRLKADLLLDGSLIRNGDGLRLSVELVSGSDGVNLWTGGGSGQSADIESLRQQVSAEVVEQLVMQLGPNRISAASTPRRSDPAVYRMLMEASELLEGTQTARMRGQAGAALDAGDRANALVERALAIEPESPFGLRMKANIISSSATTELFEQGFRLYDKATLASNYLRRALASDPDYVPALAALGEYYRRFEWRWTEARTMMERALALDPNNSDAHLSYSYYLSGSGRCVEALEHSHAALAIDPEFGWRTLSVPRALKCLGRFAESDEAYIKALDQDRGNMFILREMYMNHFVRGEADKLESLRVHVRDNLWKGAPHPDVQGWLDWTEVAVGALRGQRAPFLAMLETEVRADRRPDESDTVTEMHRRKGDVMWIQAIEFAVAGAPDRAIDMLERATADSALYIPETMPYGAFEFTPEVRGNPRYQSIWRTDPRLVELAALRLEALRNRQMHGVLPDGTVLEPVAPSRVKAS
jgi:TolB-like protein/DNA-binding winged helix-turn-helix (wHTH) protein/tetratricopeptide (TPR) repeat protein